jgi:hypothetical protein
LNPISVAECGEYVPFDIEKRIIFAEVFVDCCRRER